MTTMHEPQRMRLLAWTKDGRIALSRDWQSGTIALSGNGEGDAALPELGGSTAFIRLRQGQGRLLLQEADGEESKLDLQLGVPTPAGSLTWLLTQAKASTQPGLGDSSLEPTAGDNFLAELTRWVSQPMNERQTLNDALKEFIKLLIRRTPAARGMLVMSDGGGFSLISYEGLREEEAQKLWNRMPESLTEEILKTRAKILLPDEFRRMAPADSTVFVRGVQTMAGFPVLAEGRVVAVFYLGFTNIFKSLSAELQHNLELAADLMGLVLQRAQLREQVESLKLSQAAEPDSFPSGRLMIGESKQLAEVYRLLTRLAPVDVPVLINGETGTGKELGAHELHRISRRSNKPFVVVNAAALPEALIESELFGHKKGAFTGAISDKAGLVEQAEGGTLFIDEIGELSPSMQAKLLRVLQERCVRRVGEATPRPVDFRLVSATHQDLNAKVADGSFREDLYYRIAGAVVAMPSLRDRREDIIPLANYFKERFASRHDLGQKEWSQDARRALEHAEWPGNVRELEHVVSRAFVMAEGRVIRASDLGLSDTPVRQGASSAAPVYEGKSLNDARDDWMRAYIAAALRRHEGKRSETAKALGIGERTLFRYLEQLDLKDG